MSYFFAVESSKPLLTPQSSILAQAEVSYPRLLQEGAKTGHEHDDPLPRPMSTSLHAICETLVRARALRLCSRLQSWEVFVSEPSHGIRCLHVCVTRNAFTSKCA